MSKQRNSKMCIVCGMENPIGLKAQFYNMEDESVLAKGNFERIGEQEAFLTHKVNGNATVIKKAVMNHTEALEVILEQFMNPEYKVIDSLKEIDAVGHRIVHGGEKFTKSTIITDEVLKTVKGE